MQPRSAEGDGDAHISLPREAISCPLCEEPFGTEEPRTPCVLPCFHTFCRQCLVGWAAQGGGGAAAPGADGGGGAGYSCPTCRSVCDTGVGALQVNFALMSVIEAEQVSTGNAGHRERQARNRVAASNYRKRKRKSSGGQHSGCLPPLWAPTLAGWGPVPVEFAQSRQ